MTETRPRQVAEAFPVGEFVQNELDARHWSYALAVEVLDGDPRVNEAWLELLCCIPVWHEHDVAQERAMARLRARIERQVGGPDGLAFFLCKGASTSPPPSPCGMPWVSLKHAWLS